jgi:ribosomal protein L9
VEIGKYQNEARKLDKQVFMFTMKAGKHGEVFGSVTKKDLEKVIDEKGVKGATVVLEHPIKGTGDHVVEIHFGKGVIANMKVTIKTE